MQIHLLSFHDMILAKPKNRVHAPSGGCITYSLCHYMDKALYPLCQFLVGVLVYLKIEPFNYIQMYIPHFLDCTCSSVKSMAVNPTIVKSNISATLNEKRISFTLLLGGI